MNVLGLIVVFLFMAAGLAMSFLAMPGPLVVFFGILLYKVITGNPAITALFLGVLFGFAVIGEVLEYISGLAGARKFGASRRGLLGALAGGMGGGILGSLALPVVGSILGAVAGAFAGAFIGEYSKRRQLSRSLRAGLGTVAGRLAAAALKVIIATGMITAIVLRLF